MKNKKIKIRRFWTINPKERVKESSKKYKRSKSKQQLRKQIDEIVR